MTIAFRNEVKETFSSEKKLDNLLPADSFSKTFFVSRQKKNDTRRTHERNIKNERIKMINILVNIHYSS